MTDAETIAELRLRLAERDAEIARLQEQLNTCAWFEVDLSDPGSEPRPVPLARRLPSFEP
jgi:hypothetical protein